MSELTTRYRVLRRGKWMRWLLVLWVAAAVAAPVVRAQETNDRVPFMAGATQARDNGATKEKRAERKRLRAAESATAPTRRRRRRISTRRGNPGGRDANGAACDYGRDAVAPVAACGHRRAAPGNWFEPGAVQRGRGECHTGGHAAGNARIAGERVSPEDR